MCDRCAARRGCRVRNEYLKRRFFARGRGILDLACDDFQEEIDRRSLAAGDK